MILLFLGFFIVGSTMYFCGYAKGIKKGYDAGHIQGQQDEIKAINSLSKNQ